MNGLLHLGHAFSLSKAEFATAYARLCGRKALFPFAFHCTGMPIKAAADKIARELALHGGQPPPVVADDAAPPSAPPPPADDVAQAPGGPSGDPTQYKGKKSKAAAKTGKGATQWEIMRLSGLADDEIAPFADPKHWLTHFPPLGQRDVTSLGCGVDWRRSFVTTDANPFYDAFVSWQFRRLHAAGKVIRDKRYAVWSPLDGQPCADHDRASGEGVGPQEYVLILLPVAFDALPGPGSAPHSHVLAPLRELAGGGRVCLAAATLRPETMYGQTNCWVLPEGQYGAFKLASGDIAVMTHRAALNLSFQERCGVPGAPECVLDDITGQQLIGTPLTPPLGLHALIYALPMLSIVTTKGTGIVTSVPSDAPDDYMALQDLKLKPAFRAKYGVADAWVLPFEPVPIIRIPELGDLCAPFVCEQLKIKSQNDRALLDEAKHRTYLKGFTDGVLLVGPHAGAAVKDAKPVIRTEMVAAGTAVPYAEPEKQVISRSGDECVVALTDQWYVQYGEDGWRGETEKALAQLECYHSEARHAFEHTLGWLRQWACSRSFGLGTRVPFDPNFVIESLSDSTIYMAFYTVAHLLQHGDMYGQSTAELASKLSDGVWDHIFLNGPKPDAQHCGLSDDLLTAMRREFSFWYPLDVRVSGKDLIGNHLTFSLYTHTAIWAGQPGMWPRSVRCNGHLLLNGDKMSKSTGNFLTLEQAIKEYGADAVRIALADAGDGLDDANFEVATANAAVLRLTKELTWLEEVVAAAAAGQLRAGELSFADAAFSADLDACVHASAAAYTAMQFREALKAAFFDLHNARDAYRLLCGESGMHADVALRYCDVQARVLTPIAPHWCDHVWLNILQRPGAVLKAGWPAAGPVDSALRASAAYVHDLVADWRKLLAKAVAPPKKQAGGAAAGPLKCESVVAYVKPVYTGAHAHVLATLAGAFDGSSCSFSASADVLMASAKAACEAAGCAFDAKTMLPFLKFKMQQAAGQQHGGGGAVGAAALEHRLPFDEAGVLRTNAAYVARALGVGEFAVAVLATPDDVAAAPAGARAADAQPGKPAALFVIAPAV